MPSPQSPRASEPAEVMLCSLKAAGTGLGRDLLDGLGLSGIELHVLLKLRVLDCSIFSGGFLLLCSERFQST